MILLTASGIAYSEDPPGPRQEVRALWVIRTSLTSSGQIIDMVRRAKESGFNTIIVQVRGRGDAYYHSRWEPRAEDLKGTPGSLPGRIPFAS